MITEFQQFKPCPSAKTKDSEPYLKLTPSRIAELFPDFFSIKQFLYLWIGANSHVNGDWGLKIKNQREFCKSWNIPANKYHLAIKELIAEGKIVRIKMDRGYEFFFRESTKTVPLKTSKEYQNSTSKEYQNSTSRSTKTVPLESPNSFQRKACSDPTEISTEIYRSDQGEVRIFEEELSGRASLNSEILPIDEDLTIEGGKNHKDDDFHIEAEMMGKNGNFSLNAEISTTEDNNALPDLSAISKNPTDESIPTIEKDSQISDVVLLRNASPTEQELLEFIARRNPQAKYPIRYAEKCLANDRDYWEHEYQDSIKPDRSQDQIEEIKMEQADRAKEIKDKTPAQRKAITLNSGLMAKLVSKDKLFSEIEEFNSRVDHREHLVFSQVDNRVYVRSEIPSVSLKTAEIFNKLKAEGKIPDWALQAISGIPIDLLAS